MTRYFVDHTGRYLGGFDGAAPPDGSIEVAAPPEHGSDIWTGDRWDESASLVDYAAAVRWRARLAGIVVAGVHIAADDTSLVMIAGARIKAESDPTWTTQWAAGGSVVVPLTSAQVIAISDAVLAHVDATFATFADVVAAIAAGTITTRAEIDSAFGI